MAAEAGDESELPETKFVSWLTAGRYYWDAPPRPPISEPLSPQLVAKAFRDRLQHPGASWPEMLRRVASQKDGIPLLAAVLAECWRHFAATLPAEPDHTPKKRHEASSGGEVSGFFVYLVLSLVPTKARALTAEQLQFLREASGYDVRLLRHLLTSVAARAAEDGANTDSSEPSQAGVWNTEARALAPVFRDPSWYGDWESFKWAAPAGVSLARVVVSDVVGRELMRARGLFRTVLDLLGELTKLDLDVARSIASDAAFITEFVQAAHPRIEMHSRPGARSMELASPRSVMALCTSSLPMGLLNLHALNAGWVIGSDLQRRGEYPSPESVAAVLARSDHEIAASRVCGVALLWADVRQLVLYEHQDRWAHKDEIRGVMARLSAHREAWPGAWALCAEALLRQADVVGENVLDLLTLAAVDGAEVREELTKLSLSRSDPAVRDRANGLLARVRGGATPTEKVRQWLADTAARSFDQVPLFPHPLTPLARVWSGSVELEDVVTRSVERAADAFAQEVRDQGGAEEPGLTKALVKELEFAFRETRLRLEAGGRRQLARAITVSQRPVNPASEEPLWGCDVALLVGAQIRGSFALDLAELVQVKKSEALGPRRRPSQTESWRIDVRQLRTLLSMSESSCYWFILSSGEVACVSARVVQGLGRGRAGPGQGSFTIGYNDVRHAAVRLQQFLPELVMGAWVGSVDENTLRFARGEDSTIRPRHIFEVTLAVSGDQ